MSSLRTWMLTTVVLLAVFLPVAAMAQAAGAPQFGSVPSTDLSRKILIDYLFGPLTGAGDSPLTSVVKVINAAVLFLGGVFMMYSIIAGTMATAHDGEILGRKWSAMWLPIRTALGAAAVMPVIGGGWCAAQAIVVWLALLGISVANAAWSGFVQTGLTGNAFYNPPVMDTQVHQLYSQMLLNTVCAVAYEASIGQDLQQSPNSPTLGVSDESYGVYPTEYSITYSDKVTADKIKAMETSFHSYVSPIQAGNTANQSVGLTPVCGQVSLPVAMPASATQYQSDGTALGDTLSGMNISKIYEKILPGERVSVMAAQQALQKVAVDIVQGQKSDEDLNQEVATVLNAQTRNFASASAANAKSIAAQAFSPTFMQTLAKDGWINAGAFYMSIALAQDQITTAVTTIPSVSVPFSDDINKAVADKSNGSHWYAPWTWGKHVPDIVWQSVSRTENMLKSASLATQGGVQSVTAAAADPNGNGSWSDKVVALFSSSSGAMSSMLSGGANGQQFNSVNQDPIIAAKNLGDSMLAWGSGALAAALLLGLASYFAPGIFTILAIPFGLVYTMLIIPGMTLSFYLPMMPYILWLGVVFGWAVLLVEAVVAAPLWAVVHLAPDADGVVGRGGQGYMLVLSLTMRPVLMIAGLVFAIALMRPIGFLLNSTFGGAFAMATQGTSGWLGLFKAVAGCVIYAGVLVAMANRVFSLIHVIPDRLLRWIGGGGNELGSEAQGAERDSAAKAVAAGTAARELGSSSRDMLAQSANQRLGRQQRDAASRDGKIASMQSAGDGARGASARSDRAFEAAEFGSGSEASVVSARAAAEASYGSSLGTARQTAGTQASMGGAEADGAKGFAQRYDAAAKQGPSAMADFVKTEGKAAADMESTNPAAMAPYQKHILEASRQMDRISTLSQGSAYVGDVPGRASEAKPADAVKDTPDKPDDRGPVGDET